MINGIFGIFSILNLYIQLEARHVTKSSTVSHDALINLLHTEGYMGPIFEPWSVLKNSQSSEPDSP